MRFSIRLLAVTALLVGIVIAPSHAIVILEDNFNTGDMIGTPDVGNPWTLQSGGTVPLVDGKAIIDPTENNPTTVVDPDTGEEREAGTTIHVVQRFVPAANYLHIPPASSGRMLEFNASLMDRGENATHEGVDTGEFNLRSGLTHIFVPAFGDWGSKQATAPTGRAFMS